MKVAGGVRLIQGNKDSMRTNGEGYADPTAYEGTVRADRSAENDKWRAKKFLYTFREAERELQRIENEIKDMEDEMDCLSVKLDGMPRGSEISDRTGNLATRLADMHLEAIKQRDRAWRRRQLVVDTIGKCSRNSATILYNHFIKGETFERIAADLNYSFAHTMRLYRKALYEVAKMI
jgi:hypothetical protein